MRRIVALLFLLICTTNALAVYVAVLETGADSEAKKRVTLSDRQYLTNVLREEAVKQLPATQNYTIMTRENILQMLPPGKSIEDCEGNCLVETAKNIAADYICQARVGSFGGELTLSTELYETAGYKFVSSFNGQGSDVNDLLKIIREKSPVFFKAVREFVGTTSEVGASIPANVGNEPLEAAETPKKSGVHWIPLSVSVAATAAGAVLAVVGNNMAKDAQKAGFHSQDEYKSNKDKAHNGQILRGAGIGLAIAGALGLSLSLAF